MTTEYTVDTPTGTQTYITLSNLLTEGYPPDTAVVFYDDLVGYEGSTTIKALEDEQGRQDEHTFAASLERGLADSAAGRVSDLGDFTQYAESDRLRRLRDQVKLLQTNADRARELAEQATIELHQAIAAAMIESEQ